MSTQKPKPSYLSFFRKLRNKSREKGTSRQGQPTRDGHNPDTSIPVPTSTAPRPQPVDHSPGDEGRHHLDLSVPSRAPPTTSELQFIDTDARDECNHDISITAQASTTPRLQLVDYSSEDEGHICVPVLPRGSYTTTEPQTLDRDIPNRGVTRDSEHRILITSPVEVRNEDDSCIPNPIETLFITPVHPSINRGSKDVESRDAAHGVDTDSSIPKEVPPIATELHSVDHGVMQKGDRPSTSFFQGSSNVKITGSNFYEVCGNATIIRFGDSQFTDVQRNLICDYIANLTVLPDIKENLKKHVLTQSIITLPRAEAMFNDYQAKKKSGPCFEGTRVALLREMADWATSQTESRMYVLSGLAGIGKSTIAYTIASRAAGLNLLGASFFFSRDEADRNNAKKFFCTIAYQLCVYSEAFSKAIGDVLLTERGSAATTKDPQEQLNVLILDPLRSIVQSRARPILVVVDALDECDEDDEHAVVTGLSQLVRLLPSFKVILTTRPQPLVDHLFGNHDSHKIFRLQDIEDKVVDGDIRLYLSHSFSQEQVRLRLLKPKEGWCASDEDIESLVKAAGRLFIIASTAVLYVLNKKLSDPGARMKKLLCEIAQDRTSFQALNHFYSVIVRSAVQVDDDDEDNDDIVDRYQIIVGTIVVIQTPLPVTALACFVSTESENIYAMLRNLQSVILLGSDDIPRIYHKSFPDYLTDEARCKDPCLRIDPRVRHTQIATRCFEIMDKHLKRNILGLGDSARFMSNEDSLKEDGITKEQLEERIPQQLRYACVYWANHLEVANVEDADLMKGLEKFLDEHMLHWFEVLSLISKLDSAHGAIRVAQTLLKSTSLDLHQLLSDALRFIPKFYELINRSALHTYHSALPFTPTDSLLYRRYIKEAVDNICSVEGGAEKWDVHIANLNHEEFVSVLKFSLDNALLVSCSGTDKMEQGKLKIWDTATGAPIFTIPGDKFAVANDFSIVASSVDNVITYHNVDGSARSTMFTTLSKIKQLALSSESSRVAATLFDGTIWLWNSRNAELIDCFDGFESDEYRSQLEFSPTGTRLAYSSPKHIMQLWEGISGRFIADMPCGSYYSCYHFKFSGDGSRIASLSSDCTLALWDSESGALVGAVTDVRSSEDGPLNRTLAISANGSLLATADLHQVTLWSDSLTQTEVLEAESTGTMAFLLDNILAIGSDYRIKLYDVKIHSFISTLPVGAALPRVLTFSPDYTHLAVGDYDGSVELWDIRGIDTCSPSSRKVTAVNVLALSRDCSRLACGFEDGTVELCGTSPTKRRIASHQAHTKSIWALEFGPDGGTFASWSDEEPIKLWNGEDGALRGTVEAPPTLQAMALSNSVLVLVAGWNDGITLWSLDTLSLIHTMKSGAVKVGKVAIAENSALIAITCIDFDGSRVFLLDPTNHTTIATFDIPQAYEGSIYQITFLPDNSQLVAQTYDGDFLSYNIINKHIIEGPTLEYLTQLPNIPFWHGVPVCCGWKDDQFCCSALFSQHRTPVPVLWIPRDLAVTTRAQGLSMIVLGCQDGRIMFVRPINKVN